MYFCATRSKLSFFSGAVLLFSLALASLSNMASAQIALDLHGKSMDPLHASHGKITVLIFARTDCPITNRYVPLLLQLKNAHAEKTNFWFVYPDKNTTAEQINDHLRQFAISIPALRDPSHLLVKQASATSTICTKSPGAPALPRPHTNCKTFSTPQSLASPSQSQPHPPLAAISPIWNERSVSPLQSLLRRIQLVCICRFATFPHLGRCRFVRRKTRHLQ